MFRLLHCVSMHCNSIKKILLLHKPLVKLRMLTVKNCFRPVQDELLVLKTDNVVNLHFLNVPFIHPYCMLVKENPAK